MHTNITVSKSKLPLEAIAPAANNRLSPGKIAATTRPVSEKELEKYHVYIDSILGCQFNQMDINMQQKV